MVVEIMPLPLDDNTLPTGRLYVSANNMPAGDGGLPIAPMSDPDAAVMANMPADDTTQGSVAQRVIDKLLGTNGQERYQLWPEKLIRDALAAPHDVYTEGALPPGLRREDFTDKPVPSGLTSAVGPESKLIGQALDVSALAGTGGLAGTGEVAGTALGAGPFLRPALKYEGKIYKAPVGGEHMDAIPPDLRPEFTRQAMSGEDISNFNFGFMNHKGQFLDREKALNYAIDNGLLSPHDAKYGALTSTLMADSSKEAAAIDATAKSLPKNVDWQGLDTIERGLSPEASKALTRWVGGPPGAKESGQEFGIFDREGATKAFNDPKIKDELYKSFQPLRDQLKKEHGDEVTLYRYHGDIPKDAKAHDVLSFTSDPKVAEWVSGAPKERPLHSEADIKAKEAEFEKTGKTQVNKHLWLEKKTEMFDPAAFGAEGKPREITYTAIMRPDGMVTDTPSVREYFKDLNKDRMENNSKRSEALSKVKAYKIPVDDIIAATDRFGQKEFIVRNSKKLFSDTSAIGLANAAQKRNQ